MINFAFLEQNKEALRTNYLTASPFPYLVIDNFCDPVKMERLMKDIPELKNKSRDYVFANNKFEKSNFKEISAEFNELYGDLISPQFEGFLCYITAEKVFIDKSFFGGGLHQGKQNSFLDMHLDFNYHTLHPTWFRNLNLLLYLNPEWKEEYKGHLKLEDLRSGEKKELGVPFNRMIIQQTRAYTLHGYDLTHFPEGKFRTSIATYAYTEHLRHVEKPRTTDWFVKDDASPIKKFFAKYYNPAVKLKNKLFGSGTAKNQ